jgi:hypothetical protein
MYSFDQVSKDLGNIIKQKNLIFILEKKYLLKEKKIARQIFDLFID